MHGEHPPHNSEPCVYEFTDTEIRCCNHGELTFPSKYDKDTDAIVYNCMNMDMIRIPIPEIPTENICRVYRKVKKTNNMIQRGEKDPRHTDLVERLEDEIIERGSVSIPNTDLTREVIMEKLDAMESDIPAIIKIGEAMGEYDSHPVNQSEITWAVLVTDDEAQTLQEEFENVTTNKPDGFEYY